MKKIDLEKISPGACLLLIRILSTIPGVANGEGQDVVTEISVEHARAVDLQKAERMNELRPRTIGDSLSAVEEILWGGYDFREKNELVHCSQCSRSLGELMQGIKKEEALGGTIYVPPKTSETCCFRRRKRENPQQPLLCTTARRYLHPFPKSVLGQISG